MSQRPETDKRTAPITPECWHREASCACLRVEASGAEVHLFPYQHFVTASLVQADGADVLRLTFSSHDVEIVGRNLRNLLTALQDFGVKWLRAMPERYHPMATAESGLVSSIRITPVT